MSTDPGFSFASWLQVSTMIRGRRSAFTILELLVVVSIIAILIALILPALARAREVAYSGQCLSNLYQIAIATSLYQDEHGDQMPIGRPLRAISNYNHGGRYPVKQSLVARMFTRRPIGRPLNRYVHPDLPLGELASVSDLEDYRKFNFPVFRCPADATFNYQENWSEDGTINYGLSAYHAVGTSYYFNLAWYGTTDWKYSEVADPLGWNDGIIFFKRARLVYPSRFVSYYDDPADYHVFRAQSPELTHHNTVDRHAMTFLDGHATYITYDPAQPVTSMYAILFPEMMK
jgi:prepilin-type N-terminal cleavage/methylation domain-containing protein